MIEYIIIGVLAFIFLTLVLTYFMNSRKINKNAKPKFKTEDKPKEEVKKEEKKDPDEKVEVPSEITKEKPVERAINEANTEYHMKKAFEIIEQERIAFENDAKQNKNSTSRLKLDRGEFKSELQKSLEKRTISSETNVISSATAKMDFEISSQSGDDSVDVDKQIAEDYVKTHNTKIESIADEIRNMSPEARAILLTDILNKKY